MVPTVPAFGGVPGGPELLILLIVFVLLFGVPIAVIAGVVVVLKLRSDGEEPETDRIAELEAEVERLREKVDADPDRPDGDDRQ